ncbi:MAG: sodium:solute symporter [Bacteroidia bacterium]|nr:sodium:solute symporter [Bacteroidia bacterium]
MEPVWVAAVLISYFAVLLIIAWFTSRNADTETFFTGNRQSPWYLVAFGMIGASLSGVTFISVPGAVLNESMAYMQVVFGYILGYTVIGTILMPLYYRLNLISIYTYLKQRLGPVSYKTGSAFFILSRTMGSAMRLYLATIVLQLFLFDSLNVPYYVTAITTILLIWVYTFKGGIKTIVYTDTFQTFFLVSSVFITVFIIADRLGWSASDVWKNLSAQGYTKMIFLDDYKSPLFFPKQFFGGMFIAIAMTGLDQDLMQKNLTCRNIGEAQRNMFSFTIVMAIVTFFFMILGGLLYAYAAANQVELPLNDAGKVATDKVFPKLAFGEFGTLAAVFFLLGITASSYASADSALAALTTGFCIDFLDFENRDETYRRKRKWWVHVGFSLLFLIIILVVKELKADTLIKVILKVAAYTYGPLLGLFAFGIFTKKKVYDVLVPFVCIVSPVLCYLLDASSVKWLNGYVFGFEMLILNGMITFAGLWAVSRRTEKAE